MNYVKWNTLFFAEFLYKILVSVTLLTPQAEITMSSLYPIAQLLHDEQQSHTVGPTAQRHKMETVMGQKPVLRDEIGNFIQHRVRVP